MLNIVIKETDAFFRAGLQCFLEDFFFHNFKHLLHFDGELSHENVSAADIIFLSGGNPDLLSRITGAEKRNCGWAGG